jgi:hypothetical protein
MLMAFGSTMAALVLLFLKLGSEGAPWTVRHQPQVNFKEAEA